MWVKFLKHIWAGLAPELGDQIKSYLKNFENEFEKLKIKLKKFTVKNTMKIQYPSCQKKKFSIF